jgi:hypothetical protein
MVFLAYCFLGVAVVSDIFMGSIERVTSQKKKIKVAGKNGENQSLWGGLQVAGKNEDDVDIGIVLMFRSKATQNNRFEMHPM